MIKLNLSREIYSEDRICQAISAYEKFGKIELLHDTKNTTIIFKETRFDEELTVKEFENYLVVLENKTL